VSHENVDLTGPTRAALYDGEKPTGPLMLQGDHGPVAYRSVRIRELPQEGTARSIGLVARSLERIEPNMTWNLSPLEERAVAYVSRGHRLAAKARADLEWVPDHGIVAERGGGE
jgi:hypothetical protein